MAVLFLGTAEQRLQRLAELRELDGYQVLQVFADTGSRAILRGRNPDNGHDVLLQILWNIRIPPGVEPRDAEKIIKMQASSVSAFRHAHVVPLLSAGQFDGIPYIVSDFVEAEPLAALLAHEGALASKVAISLLVQLASAIDSFHQHRLVHGSLNIHNIAVTKSGKALIYELGFDKITEPLMSSKALDDTPERLAGLCYLAPEQLLNQRIDAKTDLYALGVIAFEMLAGHPPFSGRTPDEIRDSVLSGERALLSFPSAILEQLDEVFDTALARPIPGRFGNAHEFVCALAAALGVEPLTLRFDSEKIPSRQELGSQNQRQEAIRKPIPRSEERRFGDEIPQGMEPQTTLPARKRPAMFGHGGNPGDLFAGATESLVREYHRFSISKRQQILVLGIVICFLIASAMAVSMQGGWLSGSVVEAPEPPLDASRAMANIPPPPQDRDDTSDEVLQPPSISDAPHGVPVHELTDKQLLGILWNSAESDEVITDALREAATRGVPELVNACVRVLRHPSHRIRSKALQTAGRLGDRRIVPYVLILLDDSDQTVRREAAFSLGRLGDRKSLAFLASRYFAEPASEVRIAIKSSVEQIAGFGMSDAELLKLARGSDL